jgi:hypothetical protein
LKNKNKDVFWKKERGMALNIGELAEVSGHSRAEESGEDEVSVWASLQCSETHM